MARMPSALTSRTITDEDAPRSPPQAHAPGRYLARRCAAGVADVARRACQSPGGVASDGQYAPAGKARPVDRARCAHRQVARSLARKLDPHAGSARSLEARAGPVTPERDRTAAAEPHCGVGTNASDLSRACDHLND